MKNNRGSSPNRPDRIPEAGKGRTENRGKLFFFFFSITAFLIVMVIQSDLVVISFRSIYTAALLSITAPDALREIFTTDILEFWIGAIYLVVLPLLLALFARNALQKKSAEEIQEEREELSLGKLSLRAFMRHKIALYASAVIFVLYSAAFLAPFIAPFSPYDQQDFLVTAYQPPLSKLDALVLRQPKTLAIPMQSGSGRTIALTNSLISDLQLLKTRNEPNAIKFVNEYRIEGDSVIYLQGMRTKTIALHELAGSVKQGASGVAGGKPDFVITRTFLLGTDQYGRDILSRVIYGSKISLSIGFLVVLISVTLGTVIGVSSGYFGGWIDAVMMRIVDVLIAFPALFLILIIIATFGNSIYLIVITLSFTGWMGVARMVRSQVLSLKEQEFILAAKSLGLSDARIIFRHLAPNTLTPVIIAATLRIGSIILTEAGLSFLGLGVQPPTPSWGNIINEGRDSLLNYWWISTFPGVAILTTVVCFNLIGDGVRDALDPRMRG
ncbi:ABC transporter permease [Chlorobium sp. BLA1]|uniref:ABC transporter permease n=1 Tax=Candidatus Chlorobium masyuteum TaxID=2716876 RepID=UPI001423CE75|nr:ABC transporter permease [Candidatus Chlorobium masyuteum]